MSTTLTVSDYLKYVSLQMAAEAFIEPGRYSGDGLKEALTQGNLHNSVFAESAAAKFSEEWTVLDQCANTATGFSGTLFKNKNGELVVSFRSTEFIDDAARDNQATNTLEIKEFGFAFGQIRDMEKWIDGLSAAGGPLNGNAKVSVTGYSLGGHLATAFNVLHQCGKLGSDPGQTPFVA